MCTLAIVGSRTFSDFSLLERTINELYPTHTDIACIVSGGAYGADTLAERYALKYRIRTIVIKPKWRDNKGVYNPAAGFIRNEQIVKSADHVVAFWDSKSKGTKNSINHAKRLSKRLDIIIYTNSV